MKFLLALMIVCLQSSLGAAIPVRSHLAKNCNHILIGVLAGKSKVLKISKSVEIQVVDTGEMRLVLGRRVADAKALDGIRTIKYLPQSEDVFVLWGKGSASLYSIADKKFELKYEDLEEQKVMGLITYSSDARLASIVLRKNSTLEAKMLSTVVVRDVTSGRVVYRLDSDPLQTEFNPVSLMVAYVYDSKSRHLLVHDFETGGDIFPAGSQQGISNIQWSDDGQYLLYMVKKSDEDYEYVVYDFKNQVHPWRLRFKDLSQVPLVNFKPQGHGEVDVHPAATLTRLDKSS